MAMEIVRTEAEITGAWVRAQTAAFKADDAGDTDDMASMAYDLLQWLLGNTDVDPTEQLDDSDEDE